MDVIGSDLALKSGGRDVAGGSVVKTPGSRYRGLVQPLPRELDLTGHS